MVHDFHTHTFLSDGILRHSWALILRASSQEYKTIAVTDHARFSKQTQIPKVLSEECRRASEEWGIKTIPVIEITHVSKDLIGDAAKSKRPWGTNSNSPWRNLSGALEQASIYAQ